MRYPTPGTVFEGRYEVLEQLGEGGYGAVFRAREVAIDRTVAIKVLLPADDGHYTKGLAARFMNEARVLAQLQSNKVITLFDYGEASDGLLYMVFQFVDGRDLRHVIEQGPVDPEVALHVVDQVLTALSDAHAIGVLHRDIKPGNILVHEGFADAFAVKVVDFGIAKVELRSGDKLTRTGRVVGTLRYMAPEQHFGEELGPAMDVYAVGLVLYELLVGTPARPGPQRDVVQRLAQDRAHELPAGFDPVLSALVARMTAPEPRARFHSASEARDAVQLVIADLRGERAQTFEPDALAVPRATDDAKRAVRGLLPLALGVACLTAVGGAAAMASFGGEEPEAVPQTRDLPAGLIKAPEPAQKAAVVAEPAVEADAGVELDEGVAMPPARGPRWTVTDEGCGKPQEEDRLFLQIDVAGARRGRRFLPDKYDPNRKYPLIVAFRDINLSSGQMMSRLGFYSKEGRLEDAVIVAVESVINIDPVSRTPVADSLKLVEEASRHACLDPSRIYAFGHGDGASRAYEAACELPFSGAVLSGWAEDPDRLCQPPKHIPIVWLTMTQDEFVPAVGGVGCNGQQVLSYDRQEERLRQLNGCEPKGAPVQRENASCQDYTCSNAGLMSCRIEGGHYLDDAAWWVRQSACPRDAHQNRAYQIAWDFLVENGRDIQDEP